MKKTNFEKEFDNSDFLCPFKKSKCNKDRCTHFKKTQWKSYWGGSINIMDTGCCYAGGTRIDLWESNPKINQAYKDFDFWKTYREHRKQGINPLSAFIKTDSTPKEKIPYDFEEIFKSIQDGTFNKNILPLK